VKVAIVYNRESQNVINLFGVPNREKIGLKTIKRIADALRAGRHQVKSFEGDKDLITNLESFMPRVLKGERPGMVFNLSYGIQGQARYTHIPSILEMVGIPYVGSGPMAHSIALDKVVTKMLLKQHGLPTPDFVVLDTPDFDGVDIPYPLIAKPKNEAVSFGLNIANNDDELREAVRGIVETYSGPALVEPYIEGREINVGLLGNNPPEALPPAEIDFGSVGPPIYTYEDKTGKSEREIKVICPAPMDEELTRKARELAVKAFSVLGLYDIARVDMRLDTEGYFHILEINSLPSLGERGSFASAAQNAGLDFASLINRIVEIAGARVFGTQRIPKFEAGVKETLEHTAFNFLTSNRDKMEKRVKEWVLQPSRVSDPVGTRASAGELESRLGEIGLHTVSNLSDGRFVWTFATEAGLPDGTLLMAHVDVPMDADVPHQPYRKSAERLHGEGVGTSRAPLVMIEYAMRALRYVRRLRKCRIGVLCYADEGLDCIYSAETIRKAAAQAHQVLVLRPGNPGDRVITQRRGHRKYRLTVEGKPHRVGKLAGRSELMRWTFDKLQRLTELSSSKDRIAVEPVELSTKAFSMQAPHAVICNILLSYLSPDRAESVEAEMKEILGKERFHWHLEQISDRPPMSERRTNMSLAQRIGDVAKRWEIPFETETSLLPSVAGLVSHSVPVVCGMGPVAEDLSTPQESVLRISLVQRTLLMTLFLLGEGKH
jgi:D-alanine-D-alanine ligase